MSSFLAAIGRLLKIYPEYLPGALSNREIRFLVSVAIVLGTQPEAPAHSMDGWFTNIPSNPFPTARLK